jgi:hypothetical protein
MNTYIKRGLDIMRDPETCQTFLREQRVDDDGSTCYCAMGCLYKALVDDGIGRFYEGFYTPRTSFDDAVDFHVDAYMDLIDELSSTDGGISEILLMNDRQRLPLPQIADAIERRYATTDASNA